MRAHVFAEGSSTTSNDPSRQLVEYYEGLFGMVAGLASDLGAFAETDLHVLSEEYGVASSDRSYSELKGEYPESVGFEGMILQTREALVAAAGEADVMVILLSTDVFDATVSTEWKHLVDAAKPGSIWCLSAARSSLKSLDLDALCEKDCAVLTYERRGVARIGSETRTELLGLVEEAM